MLALQIDPGSLELPSVRRELPGHRVERGDQRPELIDALLFDPVIEMTGPDLTRAVSQHLNRSRDPLRGIDPQPGRTEQDEERHHQEEREIDALQLRPEDARLRVRLVGIRDPAEVPDHIARQVVTGDHNPRHRAFTRAANHRGGSEELTAVIQWLADAQLIAASHDLGGQTIRGGAGGRARPRRRRHCHERKDIGTPTVAPHHAVHLDPADPLRRDVGRDEIS